MFSRASGPSWRSLTRHRSPRLETSRFVVEKILPTRTMLEAELNVGVSVRDAESQRMLDDAMIKIAHHLQALREANAGRDPLARVKTGREVLSRPAFPDGRGGQ